MKQMLFTVFCVALVGCVFTSPNPNVRGQGDTMATNASTTSAQVTGNSITAAISSVTSNVSVVSTVATGTFITVTKQSSSNTTAGSAQSVWRNSCLVLMAPIALQRMLGTIH